jgi:hypothetical protein
VTAQRRHAAIRATRLAAVAVLAALAGCGGGAPAPRAPAPRAADARDGVVVWAVGDGAAEGSAAGRVVDRMEKDGVDRLLYLGDVYDDGTHKEFTRYYAPTYGRLASITSPTPGNHEWPLRRRGYDVYWRSVHGSTPRRYYALRAGGWQLISLNSEMGHGSRSRQLRWLRRAVRGPGNCRIAFWHRPRYSAGVVHGDAPDVQPFWSALRGRARIVLNGHEHDMQRFRPRDGITEFVSGAGGHSHYALHHHRARLAFGDARHDGALRLNLSPGRASWAFIAANGRRLDSGSIGCTTG